MKKLMLTVLMVVMLATPCMAEVEPEGIFSTEGTRWEVHMIFLRIFTVWGYWGVLPEIEYTRYDYAFYNGEVYRKTICDECTWRVVSSQTYTVIIDTPICTILNWSFYDQSYPYLYIMKLSPMWGVGEEFYFQAYIPVIMAGVGTMFKIEDNWTPPSE